MEAGLENGFSFRRSNVSELCQHGQLVPPPVPASRGSDCAGTGMPPLGPGRNLPGVLWKRTRGRHPVEPGLAMPAVRARILRSHGDAADDALAHWIAFNPRGVLWVCVLVDRAG